MKPKLMVKIGIDLVMTILLLYQMAYMLTGESAHEWTGIAIFVLFILHHMLNWRWYRNFPKGKYTAVRILQTTVDFLVLFSMLGLIASSVIISREVFAFLPIEGGMSFARILHMFAAYWGFMLMSVHLGIHWGMIMSMVQKIVGYSKTCVVRAWIFRILALGVSCFGGSAFFKHHIADYLFMRSQFVFFDMEQPLALFFSEYLAMMGLWTCIAYYGAKSIDKFSAKRNKLL